MANSLNVADYFVDFPDSPFTGAIVDAPLVNKAGWVGRYFSDVFRASARCLQVDAEIPALLTGLTLVDYLAGFHAGRESQPSDYKDFIHEYFPDSYDPFILQIYSDLRCGLVHNLVVVNPWRRSHGRFLLVTDVPNHLAVEDDHVVWSIATFLLHINFAWPKFGHHLIMGAPDNAAACQRFHDRFNRLAGTGAMMQRVP